MHMNDKEKVIMSLILSIATEGSAPTLKVTNDNKGRLFDLKVAQKDMKVFIGKNGNGIKSLRTVIKMLYKDDRTSLIIEEHD